MPSTSLRSRTRPPLRRSTAGPVLVSAHRGGREHGEENTWEAFRAARGGPADYVELDVRRTADGILVAYHHALAPDGTPVHRVTHGRLCALAGLDVPDVPTTLDLLRDRRVHLDVKTRDCAADVLGLARESHRDRFLVSAVSPARAAEMRRLDPHAPITVIVPVRRGRSRLGRGLVAAVRDVRACGADAVSLDHRRLTPSVAGACRRLGLEIVLWTVNEPADLAGHLHDERIAMVVSDLPSRAVAMRRNGAGR